MKASETGSIVSLVWQNDRATETPKPFAFPQTQRGTRKRGNFSDTRPPTQDRKERERGREPTEPEWRRRVSAGSLTIRYTGYLTNPFSKLKSRRPPLYKGQTGQKRKHYLNLGARQKTRKYIVMKKLEHIDSSTSGYDPQRFSAMYRAGCLRCDVPWWPGLLTRIVSGALLGRTILL